MGFTPTTTKVSKAKAAPVVAGGKGSRPAFNLKVKVGDSKETVAVTGLWEQTSKKGVNYISGLDKESGIRYMIFDSKQVEGGKELRCKEGQNGELVSICSLEPKTSKQGSAYFTGKSAQGDTFFVFANEPKS